jgi:hypothetical protein
MGKTGKHKTAFLTRRIRVTVKTIPAVCMGVKIGTSPQGGK